MTLGQLKKSLAKHPPDMDDMEVSLSVSRGGKRQHEPLCFVGYFPEPGREQIILGGLTEVQRMVEAGEIEPPEGYISPDKSDPRLFGEDEEGH